LAGDPVATPPPAPRISVVIPCWNGASYLAEAIESARSQEGDLEILVVDDGSVDASVSVAERFGDPVRCLALSHEGAAQARNRGVEAARGELLSFLDADDLWTPGSLQRLTAALDRDPALEMALGHTEQFVSPEIAEPDRSRLACDPAPVAARVAGAMLVRRPSFDRVGRFSPRLATGEFVDWYARADELGLRSCMLPDTVLRRRLHRTNHGVVRRDARPDYLRVIKASLDRRRAGKRPE
jgi:glycosyltransferase involved in cell wall biosynthesis